LLNNVAFASDFKPSNEGMINDFGGQFSKLQGFLLSNLLSQADRIYVHCFSYK